MEVDESINNDGSQQRNKPHLRRCNRNSANSLSVRSESPRASFLSLQKLKTDSLNRIDFKEPGNFGLPTRRRVMAAISSDTHSLHRTKFTNINYTEYLQNTFRNIKNDNKRKYLQQENEKYSKDCFGNKRYKFSSEISVISCNTKSRIKVSRRAMHQG